MAYYDSHYMPPGLDSSAAYQVSGIPFVTGSLSVASGSIVQIDFPAVTKFVTVINETSGTAAPLRVGFSANGVSGSNGFVLQAGDTYTGDWRVVSIFLMAGNSADVSASVVAGITGIPRNDIADNWSGSLGIG